MHIEEEKDIPAEESWYEKAERQFADDLVLEEIEAKLKEVEQVQVRTIVSSEGEWGEHQPLVDRMRKALLSDYPDGEKLCFPTTQMSWLMKLAQTPQFAETNVRPESI